VVTLEYARDKKLEQHNATALAVSVELLAPQLFDRYQNDRWWITKTGIAIKELWKMTVRPQHALAKLIILLVVSAVLFICLFSPMYHVAAPFTFDVINKRQIAAPFEGVIETVFKKPGEAIKAGDPLFKLKTFQLEVQRNEALAKAASKEQEAKAYEDQKPPKNAEALAARKERDAFMHEAAVYNLMIDESSVKSPIDGVVLTGDLTDKQDATVKLGDPLMLVGKPDDLRVMIEVPEREIQMVREGTAGEIATTALPAEAHKIKIDQIIPSGTPKEGSNTFKVYATIEDQVSTDWRPGMAGEARIDWERRPLVWIWTHRLVDWLRLKVWM
jgi:multidrug resistance efflux pump